METSFFSKYGKYNYFACKGNVGAEMSTLISIFDRLDPNIFHRKVEKTRYMKEEMDGNVFISRQSRHFS